MPVTWLLDQPDKIADHFVRERDLRMQKEKEEKELKEKEHQEYLHKRNQIIKSKLTEEEIKIIFG